MKYLLKNKEDSNWRKTLTARHYNQKFRQEELATIYVRRQEPRVYDENIISFADACTLRCLKSSFHQKTAFSIYTKYIKNNIKHQHNPDKTTDRNSSKHRVHLNT